MTSEPRAPLDTLTFSDLAARAHDLRDRINRFRVALGRFFVGKQDLVDLMTLAAVAQEPILLVGPPGTAKSDLVLKFRDALGIAEQDYFEYTLTRFTEPSEVLGPIDVSELKAGHYIRRVQGRLPTARMVFLDEVFKSNSAILNSLLTVINERKYYQDGVPTPVALEVLFAATNEIPELADLAALRDRFCLKALCQSVSEDHFVDLIDAGLAFSTYKDLGQRPWAEGIATLEDFLAAHRYLTLTMAQTREGEDGQTLRDRHTFFPDDLLHEFRRLLKTLSREDGVFISDRKIVKLYRLLRTRAWLFHGGRVERDDFVLLANLGDTVQELELLRDKVPRLLGLIDA